MEQLFGDQVFTRLSLSIEVRYAFFSHKNKETNNLEEIIFYHLNS